MKTTKELARGAGNSLAALGLARLLRLGLQIVMGRVLGAADYGVFALLMAVTYLSTQVTNLGLPQATVRFGAVYKAHGDRSSMQRLVRNSAILTVALAITASAALTFAAAPLATWLQIGPSNIGLLLICLWSIPFTNVAAWTSGIFRSHARAGTAMTLSELAPAASRGAFIIGGLTAGGGLLAATWGHWLGTATVAVAAVLLLRGHLSSISAWKIRTNGFDTRPTRPHELVRVAAPIMLSNVTYAILLFADRFLIAHFTKDPASVGVYNAAAMIAMQLAVGLTAGIAIFAPMFASAFHDNNKALMSRLLQQITWWSMIFTTPVAVIVAFNAELIMSLFGQTFAPGASVLIILAVAQLSNVATGPVGIALQMTGRQNLDLALNILLIALNLALNVTLIPRFGIDGAAAATLLSMLLAHSIRLCLVWRFYAITPLSKRAVTLTLTVVLLMAAAFLHADSFSAVSAVSIATVCIAVMAFALVAFGLDSEEKEMARSIIRRFICG